MGIGTLVFALRRVVPAMLLVLFVSCVMAERSAAEPHITGLLRLSAPDRTERPRVALRIKSAWEERITVEQVVRGHWRSLATRRPNRRGRVQTRIRLRGRENVVRLRAHLKTRGAVSKAVRVRVRPVAPKVEPPPADVPVGFNNNAVTDQAASPEQAADLLSAVGADIDRVQINWVRLEPTPGNYNFAPYDAIYAADLERGIRPLFIFAFAPQWANGSVCPDSDGSCHAPPTPDHYVDAARTTAVLAARYPEAAGIEIWNEPNMAYFWRPSADPYAYTDLLAACHAAIKSVDPDMPVVGGSMASGAGGTPAMIAAPDFLAAMYQRGAAEAMDAISMHTYPYPSMDSAVDLVKTVRRVRDSEGNPATAIWITETGATTTGTGALTEEEQLAVLVELDRRLRAVAGVGMLLFHTLIDPPRGATNPETGYGVVAGDLRKKPAYCALGAAWGLPSAC